MSLLHAADFALAAEMLLQHCNVWLALSEAVTTADTARQTSAAAAARQSSRQSACSVAVDLHPVGNGLQTTHQLAVAFAVVFAVASAVGQCYAAAVDGGGGLQ